MSAAIKGEEINNSEFQKSKVITSSEYNESGQTFNIELSVSQANAIAKLLPFRYTINIERTIKPKRVIKKKFTLDAKNLKNCNELSQQNQVNKMAEEPVHSKIQTINYDDMIRKCHKILGLLRKNKASWPFKEPVDPIAMGIPHYRDIVTNPMDLRTIGQNLLEHKYLTMSQFYADVQLIIKNSYTFNKNNSEFCGLTSQFQKYFQKLKLQSTEMHPVTKKIESRVPSVKQRESNHKNDLQLNQRKQLAMKLKYLPKDQLVKLVIRMNETGEKSTEINLETLPYDKIQILRQYIQRRQNTYKSKQLVKSLVKDESSFQSDSDS